MPNAGHTVVDGDRKVVFKVLPSGVVTAPEATAWVCPGSVFDPVRLGAELAEYRGDLFIHERATKWLESDKEEEAGRSSVAAIASTGQGCSIAMMRKRFREKDAIYGGLMTPSKWMDMLHSALGDGDTFLHEVSQGFALSLDWGTHYPECTSRNCTVQGAFDELGAPPSALGDVYLNLRTYPIRVGNTSAGNSGGWWWDQVEVDWEHVAKTCGMDPAILKSREMTTVTKRLRRVATFSFDLARIAAKHNAATKIFINFANYICPGVDGLRGTDFHRLPTPVRVYCNAVEDACQVAVVGVGTGPDVEDVVWWG